MDHEQKSIGPKTGHRVCHRTAKRRRFNSRRAPLDPTCGSEWTALTAGRILVKAKPSLIQIKATSPDCRRRGNQRHYGAAIGVA